MDQRAELMIRYAGGFWPGVITRASGSWLETADGRRVLDFTSGQLCATVGHSHPHVTQAIERSLRETVHLNSRMLSTPVLDLAETLVGLMPGGLDRVLLLSTGGEANEAAIRMAKHVTGGFEVLGLTRSWHGMTMGTQAVTYAAARRGHGPQAPGAFALPAPYAYRCPIRHCADTCDHTCLEVGFEQYDEQSTGSPAAVIAEPVLSAGGVIVPPPGYFAHLAGLARERGMPLIMDEAQTGFGRLGAMFGFEHFDVRPEFVTLSKSLGGGLPLSAVVTTAEIEQTAYERGLFYYTSHQSDPLPAAAGLAVLDVVRDEDLVTKARERGERLGGHLRELQKRHEAVGDVRGLGLLWGLEFVADRETREPAPEFGDAVTAACERAGLCMNIVRSQSGPTSACMRIAPPLTVSDDEIDTAAEILDEALTRTL